MGLARWQQCREARNELKIISGLDQESRNALLEEVSKTMVRISLECGIPVDDIIFSESYHPVEDGHWGQAPFAINTKYRLPLAQRAKQGDDAALFFQLAAGVILHSVRAILDFEVNNRTDLLMHTKSIWYYLANGDFEQIPPRFHSNNS